MSMLDRTEILFAPRGDFGNQGEQSVGIRAINATDLLDGVQIGQPPAIEDQVVFRPNLGNSVDWEADKLVDGNSGVKQQKRKNATVNERRRQDYQQARIPDVFPTGPLQPAVFSQRFRRRIQETLVVAGLAV